MNRTIENNIVELSGVITSEPVFSHEFYGEKFYIMTLEAKRTSGIADVVPLTISERLFKVEDKHVGLAVNVYGSFRSFNEHDETGNHLILSVFVQDIEEIITKVSGSDKNEITLNGFICKEPIYRKTPLGREVADVLLAVGRYYGKTDYIPCITWGRNAAFSSGLKVGTKIKIKGRVQSRIYKKKISDTDFEERIAYEVSASNIEVAD